MIRFFFFVPSFFLQCSPFFGGTVDPCQWNSVAAYCHSYRMDLKKEHMKSSLKSNGYLTFSEK